MNSTLKNFAVFPFCKGNTYIVVCPALGTVDQGTTLESAFIYLQKTTQVYLQAANLNITPVLIGADQLNFTSPSLPQVSSSRFITALERLGFRRTSHCVVLKKQSERCEIVICAVPLRYPLVSTTILNDTASVPILSDLRDGEGKRGDGTSFCRQLIYWFILILDVLF